jgi:outer membrane autotransporter protein
MTTKTLSIVALFGVLATTASAQIPNLGATAGLYFPVSREMRDAFGNSIFRFGFGQAAQSKTGNLKIGTSFDIITANHDGNRLFMLPVTLEVEQQLTMNPGATTKPYAKAFIGAAFIDYGITQNGNRFSSQVIRPTLGAELGLVFAERLRLAARYNAFQKTGGFDFSGVSVSLTFNLMP